MNNQVKKTSIQLVKYMLIGASNTLITFIVFVVLNSFLGVNFYVSNIIGYIAGVVNSFVWNKTWVFKTRGTAVSREALLFVTGFSVCYCIQLAIMWVLMNFTSIRHISIPWFEQLEAGETLISLIGMAIYTICNYVFNRFVTFKTSDAQ
ncbi:MAG: GtrA family protein [Muribaculaceae bacterium]|nr:GtrA family protein [Muribaculaceae bacterium]